MYDYSEGEVLHSWKQFQIEGILKLRIKFMKHFVNYVREIVRSRRERCFSFEQIPFVHVRVDNHSTTKTWKRIR